LRGRTVLSDAEYEAQIAKNDSTLAAAREILAASRCIETCKADNVRLSAEIIALAPWRNLTVPTGFAGTKTTTALIGTLPGGTSREEVSTAFAEKLPLFAAYDFELISEQPACTCIFLLCRSAFAPQAEEVLRAIGFVRVAAPTKRPPAEEKALRETQIEANKAECEAAKDTIRAFAPQLEALRFYVDYCAMRKEKYEVIGTLAQSRHAFFLQGYIARENAPALEAALTAIGVATAFSELPPDAEIPVALKNNGFAAPVESVVESYSMPGKGELDPSFVMSLFYYVLFGLMLSDAGYGLLMVLCCGYALARYQKTMETPMKNTLKMFFFCGISTTVWGFVFGSFFGDAIAVVASTFFGSTLRLPALWFEPLTDPMKMLIFSLALGVVHLFTGLAMNIAQHWKNKEYLDMLYDAVFWYMLVGGLIVMLATTAMFSDLASFRLSVSPLGMLLLKVVILTGAVGIVLTAGRESRNWFKRLLKGLYGLYNVSGYLSDILSYSRLL
ncbi:MAG: V-type ATPase 116kDa subunit family protein, partial [Pygmaiobacter sp.]